MTKFLQLIWLIIIPFLFSNTLSGQTDAHYWTHQYGAKGLLLNGAVIASTDDETAIFYNPAAMGNGEAFGLSLSFLTPSYSILKTDNFLGNGNSITDRDFGFAPGFGAVGFNPFKNNKKFRAGVTSFTRFKSNISYRARTVEEVQNQADQLFIGNLEFKRGLSERWFGFGLAYKVSDILSIGATQFVTFHGENSTVDIQKEIVYKDHPTEIILGWRNKLKYSFSARFGTLTKFGVALNLDNAKAGLTITTPTYYSPWRSASYDFDDLKTYGRDSTVLLSNLNSAELLDYQTPFSIGVGLDFPVNKTRVSFSMEYFKSIPVYTLIDEKDDPFEGLSSQDLVTEINIQAGNRDVVNFALGCQTMLNDNCTMIWGFRTDFNQRRIFQELTSLQFLATTPNVYHFSLGSLFTLWENQISFGLDYSFGVKEGDTQLVDFSNITSENLFDFTDSGKVTSSYQAFLVILTYDFIFKRRRNKNKK